LPAHAGRGKLGVWSTGDKRSSLNAISEPVHPSLRLTILPKLSCLGAALGSLALPVIAWAQTSSATSDLPRVFSALEGAWDGTGTLLERAAEFRMEWSVGGGGFVHLSFANAWVGEEGSRTPVLQSEATYLVRGSTAQGVWIDTRPQRIQLAAIVTDSSVVTTWTAEAERGRTEHVVRSPDEVFVRDLVEADGEFRLFAEARYRRRVAPPPD